MKFSKMQSLGNDFVVIDGCRQAFTVSKALIKQWADRHLGIGFDQLLVVAPATVADADFDYLIYNADGSKVTQCGNGARCLAAFIKTQQLSDKTTLRLNTGVDIIEVTCLENNEAQLTIAHPNIEHEHLTIEYDQQKITGTVIDVGNPHFVVLTDALDSMPLSAIGAYLQTDPAFKDGVNVGYAQVVGQTVINLRVYERGVGETLACGSGALAAAIACIAKNETANKVTIHQAGGKLRVSWPDSHGKIHLQGAVEHVFDGVMAT